ncbi:MAG: O-antigen ligase family protein [Candidatus Moranbacteria bacterium]|nr:O-antigen ligase family protein [Candidatus Moranbacteria bacterium]
MLTIISLLYLLLPFQIALSPSASFDVASVRIIIPLIVITWLIKSLITKKLWVSSRIQTPLLLSFLFLSTLSLISAQEISWGLRKLLFLLSFFPLYFVLTAILDTHEKVRSLMKYVVLGSFALAITGIVQFLLQFLFPLGVLFRFWTSHLLPLFLGDAFAQSVANYPSIFVDIGGHTLMRAVAIFPDPHMLSFYLGMTAPLAIGLALTHSHKKYFFFFIAAALLVADLLTFSRGGYLGIIGGLLFLFILQFRTWAPRTKKTTLALLIASAFVIFSSPIGTRLISSFNTKEGSNQGRIEMWRAATDIIKEYPFFGVGTGNYSLAVKPSASYRDPIYAHNLFLDIAAETGIANALIFLSLILVSLFSLYKNSLTQRFYLWPALSIIIFTVHSLVETPLYSVHILPLFIFLIALNTIKNTD